MFVNVKYKPISIKIGRYVLEETINKTMQNCPLHPKHVLTLPWEIWSDRLSRRRSTYMNIIINHWIANNTFGSYCFKNRETCSRSHHFYIICSKCLPPAWTQARRLVATSPTARSMHSVIQTVHSFLIRYLSSSTSEIFIIHAGVGQFEHVV